MKPKKCLECGKTFTPKNGHQKYCSGPHTSKCVVCGHIFEYTCRPSEKPKTCSRECQTQLQHQTAKTKYGLDNVSQIPEVRKKISDNHKSEEFKSKVRNTCQHKYGVDNPAQSDTVRSKLSTIMKSEKYLSKRRTTCLEKYGVENPTQTIEVIEKRQQTCLEKYGSLGAPKSKSFYEKKLIDETKVDEYLEFKQDPDKYISTHYKVKPSVYILMNDLGCTETPIYDILVEHSCSDLILHSYSLIEEEIYEFLLSLSLNSKIYRRYRKLIAPYEVDFYLPDYQLAIEVDPAATHNSSTGFLGNSPKHYRYHQMKSEMCADNDVFLFHIFGYEWKANPEIIKSMLANLLGQSKHSFGARQTYVCCLSYSECKDFLHKNHRHGSTQSKVRLGLRLKKSDELVSVMTFNKLRPTIGKTQVVSEFDWELSRFCTKLYTNIAGGASKLFNYFINNYKYDSIVSFSDIAHTRGKMYEKLGFRKIHNTAPSYFWTTDYDTKFLHRVNTQKRNLKSLLNDEGIDLNKTEAQIMEEHGYVRTFDCGVIKWEWTASDLQ